MICFVSRKRFFVVLLWYVSTKTIFTLKGLHILNTKCEVEKNLIKKVCVMWTKKKSQQEPQKRLFKGIKILLKQEQHTVRIPSNNYANCIS